MSTLYYYKKGDVGNLCKLSKISINDCDKVTYGSPVSIEYKKIKLVSQKLDFFGKSEIMVVNYIKTTQSKESALESITYYDKNATPKRMGFFEKIYEIENFNPAEYGNPTCYYNPGYQDTVINICTKFYELDNKFSRPFKSLIALGTKVPGYGMYFSITDKILEGTAELLYKIKGKKSIVPDHIIQFRPDEESTPFVAGKYICFPEQTNLDNIIKDYNLIDYQLLNKENIEYAGSYFILKVSTKERKDLLDFDFLSSSNELLSKLNVQSAQVMEKYADITKESYDFNIIKEIINSHKSGDLLKSKSLYSKLQEDTKKWFNEHFRSIFVDIANL